jgi:hypothetical protein
MATPMIACCGLVCTDCGAYLATRTMDQAKAAQVAAEWSKQFHVQVLPEHVWCDGCTVAGRKCAHCAECEIRACALERNLANCGLCDEYACEKLQGFFAMVPPAKAVLDRVRASTPGI